MRQGEDLKGCVGSSNEGWIDDGTTRAAPAVTFQWMLEGFQRCFGASPRYRSGQPGRDKSG